MVYTCFGDPAWNGPISSKAFCELAGAEIPEDTHRQTVLHVIANHLDRPAAGDAMAGDPEE